MITRYNLDSQVDYNHLVDKLGVERGYKRGAIPRKSIYGTVTGFKPFGEEVDKLVDEDDYRQVIEQAHEDQTFPVYHQHASWAPPGFRWNQNGLGYCWIWSLAGCMMDRMAIEGRSTVLLSPVTMGRIVDWKDEGNYLEEGIRGAQTYGLAEMSYTPDQHSLDYRHYKPGWEDNALLNRLGDVWDLDNRSKSVMIQHSVSVSRTGASLYIAYNWWGHALNCVGLRWDKSEKYNLVWVIRNSHDEEDVIELTGTKGVPDEAYGIRSMRTIF